MVKFFKIKGTEIRKAVQFDEDGNRIKGLALIGQVHELIDRGVLTAMEPVWTPELWVVVPADATGEIELLHYDTLKEAKESIAE